MLNISLKKLNDFIQPLGYTVAIVRDSKESPNGPYHSIWIGENDEFLSKSDDPDTKKPQALDDAIEVLRQYLGSDAQIIIDMIRVTHDQQRKEK